MPSIPKPSRCAQCSTRSGLHRDVSDSLTYCRACWVTYYGSQPPPPEPPQPCQFWRNTGRCKFGDVCRFLHGDTLACATSVHPHTLGQAPALALRAARRIVTCVPPSALAAGSARPAATMCCAVRASTRTALQQRRLLTISWRGESGESCYRHRPPLTKTGARVGAPSAKPLRCSRASRLGHRRSGRRPPGRASRPPSPVAAPRSSLRRNKP